MSATVPTKAEFDALTAKVTALTAAQTATAAELARAEGRISALEIIPPPVVPPVIPPVVPPVVVPPVLTGLPNPLRLPAAVDQVPDPLAYDLLNVPAMIPGTPFLDLTTGVTIVKLTTATSPIPGTATQMCGVDYATGGNRIGRPTNGVYPITCYRSPDGAGDFHVITFNPTTKAVGYRCPAPGASAREISRAMSYVTPNVMYAFGGTSLRKYAISGTAPVEITGGVWPKDWSAHLHGATRFVWLQSTADDRYFAAQAGDAGPWVIVWDSQTDTFFERAFSTNEFKMSKDSPYIHNTTTFDVWNVLANSVATIGGMSGVYPSHSDTARQYVFGSDVNAVHPGLWYADLESASPARVSPNETYYIANLYTSGGWVDQPSDTTQWVTQAYQTFNGPTIYSNEKMEPGSIGMIRLDNVGGLRLLCQTYNRGDVNAPLPNYYTNSIWPNMSPDGKFCLFKSNMNRLGGFASLFAAILPEGP